MKYYLYLSKSKIEMLAAQIPSSALKGVSAEFKANIGVLSSTVKAAEAPAADNVFSKTEAVAKHLKKLGKVGTISEPKLYVGGMLPMRWGTLWDYASDLLFFSGESNGRHVALVGASASAIGAPLRVESQHSLEYYSLRFLNGMLESKLVLAEDEPEQKSPEQHPRDHVSYMRAIGKATSQLPQEVQGVEFIARVLFVDQAATPGLIVATPLFAYLSEEA